MKLWIVGLAVFFAFKILFLTVARSEVCYSNDYNVCQAQTRQEKYEDRVRDLESRQRHDDFERNMRELED